VTIGCAFRAVVTSVRARSRNHQRSYINARQSDGATPRKLAISVQIGTPGARSLVNFFDRVFIRPAVTLRQRGAVSPRNIYMKKYFATFSQSSVLKISALAFPQPFSGLEIERR